MANTPQARNAVGLAYLPLELLQKICSELSQFKLIDENPDTDEHQLVREYSLDSFCRVSRRLYEVGMPYQYQIVHAHAGNMESLSRTLISRPDLADVVKQLYFNCALIDGRPATGRPTLGRGGDPADDYTVPQALSELLLEKVRHLEVLVLRVRPCLLYSDEVSQRLRESLANLKEFRVDCTHGHCCLDDLAYLIEAAPQLITLTVKGSFTAARNNMTYLKGIKNLKLEWPGSGDDLTDILAICEGLTSFTYVQIPHARNLERYEEFLAGQVGVINDILTCHTSHHTNSLRSLQLEMISRYMTPSNNPKHLKTLASFRCLEDLSLTTHTFVDSSRPEQGDIPTRLLETLPESIRRLSIYRKSESIDSQLVALVKAQSRGSYPNLEEIIIRRPLGVLDSAEYMAELKECCRPSKVQLSFEQSQNRW